MRRNRFGKVRAARHAGERGQSLIEALVALAVTSLVLGAVFGALAVVTRAKARVETRASASDAAANAATELRAACEYDADALAAVGNASWTVLPPSPPPGASPADASPVTLATQVAEQQDGALVVGLSFSAHGDGGAATLVLQQYAPVPGAQVYGAAALPPASP